MVLTMISSSDVVEQLSDVIKSKIPANTSQKRQITQEELRGKELAKLKGRDRNVLEHLLQENVFDSNTAPRVDIYFVYIYILCGLSVH